MNVDYLFLFDFMFRALLKWASMQLAMHPIRSLIKFN